MTADKNMADNIPFIIQQKFDEIPETVIRGCQRRAGGI